MYGYHRDLHVLPHAFPTRRSSELLISMVSCTGAGRMNSLTLVQEHVPAQPPHTRLNHRPPISAGCGYQLDVHDDPKPSYIRPLKQSVRHGRSVMLHSPNRIPVLAHSTSDAVATARTVSAGFCADRSQVHSTGQT